MNESDALRKFQNVLQHFDLNEKVKIEFCENKLDSPAIGKVETVVEYRISLDKALLTDPEKMESDWNGLMGDFSDNVVPCLSRDDRIFLVFLHELAHVINGDCLKDSPEDDEKENKREQKAWDFAWRVYRAYRAGQEQAG